jgi:tetratricopeptide (TPR) repeat protein
MNVSKDFILKACIILVASVAIHFFLYNSSGDSSKRHDKYHGFYAVEQQSDNSDHWIFFTTVLSTLFAVFFVYSGFKIDSSRDQINDAEKRIHAAEKKINEDLLEYTNQLQYAMSFILSKEFRKALDALKALRDSPAVLKDDRKINTCNFYLAHCYYEKGLQENSIEDMALAVEYVEQAYEAPDQPFKLEVIEAFNKMNEQQNHV